jgi:hypothetical protein
MPEINLCARDKNPGSRMPAADRLDQVHRFFQQHRASEIVQSRIEPGTDGVPELSIMLHPAASLATFSVSDDGRLWASAHTLSAGPGYHADLCTLLKQLADELAMSWDEPDAGLGTGDPTTYFQTGLFGRVQHAMIARLRHSLKSHLSHAGPFGRAPLYFPSSWMPAAEGNIYTLVGPRTPEWARAVVEGDNVRALNIFPWQQPQRDYNYWLGRAYTDMWCNVRWRPPIVEEERRVLQGVVDALEAAHRLDPSGATYWREWNEIRGFLGIHSPPPADPGLDTRHPSQIPAGYRRSDISVFPAGVTSWHLTIPGALAIEGSETQFRAFDPQRQITFRAFVRKGDADLAEQVSALLEDDLPDSCEPLEQLAHATERMVRMAVFFKPDHPDPFPYRLLGFLGTDRELARCAIDIADLSLRGWAMAAWQSIAFANVKRNGGNAGTKS